MRTLEPLPPPLEWQSKQAAERAANGVERYARWAGDVELSFVLVAGSKLSKLGAGHVTKVSAARQRSCKGSAPVNWDEDGMFPTPGGQVSVKCAQQWVTQVSDLPCKIRREGGQSLVTGGPSLVILEGREGNPL